VVFSRLLIVMVVVVVLLVLLLVLLLLLLRKCGCDSFGDVSRGNMCGLILYGDTLACGSFHDPTFMQRGRSGRSGFFIRGGFCSQLL
jgi:hypothetical protein